ncbi:MAG: hypothetical protein ACLFTV_19690, partial [Desulfococcaceae bacterium]
MAPDPVSDSFRNGSSTTRLVLGVLRSGAAITAKDAAERASEKAGRTVNPGTVSGILSRVGDPERCDLGHFIHKGKSGGARVYLLAEEALSLTETQLHGLTLRTGPHRYSLEQAVADHPRLRRLLPAAEGWTRVPPESTPTSEMVDSDSAPAPAAAGPATLYDSDKGSDSIRTQPARVDPVSRPEVHVEEAQERKRMEVAFRFGGEEALSLNTSPALFWLLCAALVIVFVSLALLGYTVLLPLLVI